MGRDMKGIKGGVEMLLLTRQDKSECEWDSTYFSECPD